MVSLYYLLRNKHLYGFYLLLLTAAWAGYVTSVGGDIFPAFRHYYVVIILFVFAIILGLQYFKKLNVISKNIIWSVAVLLIINGFNWKIAGSEERKADFTSDIRMKNGQLIVDIVPKNKMFLESLVLERKY